MRFERVAGNRPGVGVAQAFVQAGRTVFGCCVQHQQGTPALHGQRLGGVHQRGGYAAAPVAHAGHHFGDFGAVGLVGRAVQQQRDGARQHVAVPCTQHHTFAALRRCQRLVPKRFRRCQVQRVHKADRSAVGYCFYQQLA